MLSLFLSSFISLILFTIYGTFISKVAFFRSNIFINVLIGIVAINTLTSFLSLFFPINNYVLFAFILSSIILFFFIKKELKSIYQLIKSKKSIIIYSLPFILVTFIISINSPQNYDTGLYHIQTIKWIEEYAVVPGLANLHGRFGFNPNIFTLFALTSLFDIFGQLIFSINFTLLILFILYFINQLYFHFKQSGINHLFILNLIVFLTILSLQYYVSSPSPDFISIVFPLFIFTNLINQGVKNDTISDIPTLILCLYSITVKLATLPVLILVIFILVKHRKETKTIKFILALFCLIIFPWLFRNIILSGWLIYPFYSIDLFNFDWKVPLSKIIHENESIIGWARNPGKKYIEASHMNLFYWFPEWWYQLKTIYKLLFLSSIAFTLLSIIGQYMKKIKLDFNSFAIIITSFFGILFWLMLAPDLRFGKAFLIFATLSPLLFLKFNFKPYAAKFFNPFLTLISIAFLFFVFCANRNTDLNFLRTVSKNPSQLILPKIIESPVTLNFKTINISGINCYMPLEGDRCYNYCIPCTPYFDTALILRGTNLKSGFKHKSNGQKDYSHLKQLLKPFWF
ncbi:MAG: hypothetical protein PSX81_03540 [bacterium]|nr:hypothetical protein [bacterium]